MASFNKVILMGNLTRDPDVRATGTSGMKVARLGIAVNERRRDRNGQVQEFPVFVDVDAWDKLAELCGQYLSKGRSILVEGRLQMDTWEKEGVRHQKLKVRATTIKFLPQGDRLMSPQVQHQQESHSPAMQNPLQGSSLEGDPDDIPF
ncbi:MAG: single-stranded DNA-binding protein [Kiritimatiellae bacterium]|nr:single-stranded DNA-binding protein [Kiritimatiellia bacterium]